jgi:septal ring factor EnvC (AmiA/AmiB activator)
MSGGAAHGEDEMQARIAALEAELASVRRAHDLQTQARDRAEHEREQYRKLYSLVAFELERLKRQLFGKKAETVMRPVCSCKRPSNVVASISGS